MDKPAKFVYRSLFLALQADAKGFPGGIRALAELMGVNGHTLANSLNPDHDAQPPAFGRVLDLITLTQAQRTVFAIAALVGQVPMAMAYTHPDRREALRLFLSLIEAAGLTFEEGAGDAQDGYFDRLERQRLEPLLLRLIQASAELLAALRG